MGIVAELRSDQTVTQFDSAGRIIQFDGTPTDRERKAADHIEALHTAVRDIAEFARNGDTVGAHEAIGRALDLIETR